MEENLTRSSKFSNKDEELCREFTIVPLSQEIEHTAMEWEHELDMLRKTGASTQ